MLLRRAGLTASAGLSCYFHCNLLVLHANANEAAHPAPYHTQGFRAFYIVQESRL